MSELETPPPSPRAAKTGWNVYTALLLTAFFALTVGVTVLWVMNVKLTGESNPFFLVK